MIAYGHLVYPELSPFNMEIDDAQMTPSFSPFKLLRLPLLLTSVGTLGFPNANLGTSGFGSGTAYSGRADFERARAEPKTRGLPPKAMIFGFSARIFWRISETYIWIYTNKHGDMFVYSIYIYCVENGSRLWCSHVTREISTSMCHCLHKVLSNKNMSPSIEVALRPCWEMEDSPCDRKHECTNHQK